MPARDYPPNYRPNSAVRSASRDATTTGAASTTDDGQQSTANGTFGASVTIAGLDGAPIVTITRHRETVASEPGTQHDQIVVAVIGDVDADSAPSLLTALTEAFDNQSWVCCDLGQAAFFGAAGANALVIAHHQAIATGCHFAVRDVHGVVQWTLNVTGLDRLLTLND